MRLKPTAAAPSGEHAAPRLTHDRGGEAAGHESDSVGQLQQVTTARPVFPPGGPAIRAGYVHLGRPYRAVQGQGIGRSGRGAWVPLCRADSGAGGHLAGLSVRVAVVVGRPNRSASGPRPQPCTQAAPCRRRLAAGEARSRRSARRAACSNTHPANGHATVTNASCRVRSCRLVDGLPRRVGRGSPLAASGGRRHRARGCPTWPGHERSCNQWSTG